MQFVAFTICSAHHINHHPAAVDTLAHVAASWCLPTLLRSHHASLLQRPSYLQPLAQAQSRPAEANSLTQRGNTFERAAAAPSP
eukprot:NODE_20394_length_800_cov_4.297177.p2 GENE.NODE_20394_length_800_cov_4.297177~~NODE_20394_length_800_cov_4.297177.p2  ORF type:complete len:84 (+),score=14.94 NODE_20394_length_800_cov_4.297177:100-351(+)